MHVLLLLFIINLQIVLPIGIKNIPFKSSPLSSDCFRNPDEMRELWSRISGGKQLCKQEKVVR